MAYRYAGWACLVQRMVLRELSLLMLAFQAADGFGIPLGFGGIVKALKLRTAPAQIWKMASSLTEPARAPPLVAGTPIPRIYVYDHCPFCVRVRLVLGLKNIKHNIIYLANDDVETPTRLVRNSYSRNTRLQFS